MLDKIRTAAGTALLWAAAQLPPSPEPKVKKGPLAYATYLTSAKPSNSALPVPDRRLASTDVTTLRNGASTRKILRDFVAASPDLSAAVFSYGRVGIPKRYTAVAVNPDGTFNPDATSLVQQVIARMDMLPNYADGFAGVWSIRALAESFAKELATYGACSGELVLDKTRIPARIQPLSVTNIEFIPDKDGLLKPQQNLAGTKVDLDVPTFFYVALDQDLLEAYSSSMLEPSLKPVIFSEDFMADLHKVVKRAVHPRISVSIDHDKLLKSMPTEAQHDEVKRATWLNSVITQVQETVNGLQPEEALVQFDFIKIDYLNNGNISLSNEYTALQDIANARLSTGAKTMPSILGHGVGSQNVASAESMMFVKNTSGAITFKLNEIFSRIFTLSARLFGHDVVVRFEFDDIDLRPESELESFRQTKQSRLLELLSLGMITDEEACLALTGKLPPAEYKPLSGTMFKSKQADGNDNPNGESNSGSTLNQKVKSDQPAQGRGQNNKSNPVKE